MQKTPDIVKELKKAEEDGFFGKTLQSSSQQFSSNESIKVFEERDLSEDVSQLSIPVHAIDLENNVFDSWDIYKSLFEHSPDGIVIVDFKGIILSCNPAISKMTGFEVPELIGKHFSKTKIFDLKELPNLIKLFYEILHGKTKGPFELRYFRKDGSSFWSEVHISLLRNKKHSAGLIVVSRDITERKKAEKLYRELYEGSPDGFALVDLNGCIIKSNSTFQNMLGYSADELRTKTYEDLTLAKWHKMEADILKEQVFKRGYSEVYEKEYLSKNGTIIPIEIRTYLLEEDGIPKGMWAFVRDVSDRKQKENEIEESKSHFQHLFNAIADPIVIVDNHGKFLEISDGVENLTGYKRDDLIGKNFLRTKLVTKRSKTILLANLAKRMTGFHVSPYEIEVVSKQGKIVPFEINAAKINYKGQTADMVVFRDVRDRRKSQAALRESEEKFRLLSDQSLMGIAIIQGSDIKYANQAATNITEYPKEEMIKQGVALIRRMIHPDDVSFVMEQLNKKLHGDKDIVPHYSYRIITKNGKTRWLDQFSKSITYSGNTADFVTIIDITDKKEAEEKIKQQNIQLRKMDKLKTDFLNVTSHELRSPMTAMKGYIQMLISEVLGTLSEEQKNALEVILRNTNRLDHLVQDILDTSRLESGTMKFIPSNADIGAMITDIIETMQLSADIKQIKLDALIEKNLPSLIIDAERIKQVFDNIINNAIKFSSCGSKIFIRAKKEDEYIQFEIQDFGKGIPENKKEKIFETFYQVEYGMDRTFGGTGLGLTISRGIILAHGGRIWVDSTIGEGSIFKFTLPIMPIQDVEGTFKKVDIFDIKNNGIDKSDQE